MKRELAQYKCQSTMYTNTKQHFACSKQNEFKRQIKEEKKKQKTITKHMEKNTNCRFACIIARVSF